MSNSNAAYCRPQTPQVGRYTSVVIKNADSLEFHLAAAAEAARYALQRMHTEREAFLDALRQFEVAVEAADVQVEPTASASTREATEAFRKRYDALRGKLDGMVEHTAASLSKAYLDIERDSAFVTIMLFGRTRAGKSTTMEALTGGDGSSIGMGGQHTTTDVRAYYFPRSKTGAAPEGPALRIVDTPGIDGFHGEALAEMAEEFVERSDHILFLLTDDKATADELDRFGAITTQGKGVTVLLNVKASDEDLDLLLSSPELIFKTEELEGHSRRICGYLGRNFDIPPPRLIPLHARAAWLGRSDAELPDGVESREMLVQHSRLLDVESRISEFIRNDALPARMRAPRDLLLSYLLPLKNELHPFASEFRQMMGDIQQVMQRLERGSERARKRVASRFPLLRARFQAASDAIPGMVDSVIAGGANGDSLNSQWQQLLRTHGVTDATDWFVTVGRQDFEAELAEEVRVTTFDYAFTRPEGIDQMIDGYHDAENSASKKKYARAGIRTLGGAGTAALATWAITNWWNPTGWAAAAAVVVAAGSGLAGEAVARKITDNWERSTQADMYNKRVEIIKKLRDQIWNDFHGVRSGCGDWLDKTKALHLDIAHEVARPIQNSARHLWQASITCLRYLDEVADRVSEGLVADIFSATVPECADGAIQINSVIRSAGYRTKVIVSSAVGHRVAAMAACIGRQGQRIRQIRSAIGGEPIDLIDGQAPYETQILQALGVPKSAHASVTHGERAGVQTVFVRVDAPYRVSSVLGHRGANIRMAERLFGINIFVEGVKS